MDTNHFLIYGPEQKTGEYLARIVLYLRDEPGSLAKAAKQFGNRNLNIVFFSYNRTEHPNRVVLEVVADNAAALESIRDSTATIPEVSEDEPQLTLGVTDVHNILKIDVQVRNTPGSLAGLASLLGDHRANVIYLSYLETSSPTTIHVTITADDGSAIDLLLRDLATHGYGYEIISKGSEQKEIDDIIGLNLIEKFYFRLKRMLPDQDVETVKKFVESSGRLTESLRNFSREAGRHLEEGAVLTKVLAFASVGLSRTGKNFSYRKLPSLPFGPVIFHAFRIPTGGNIYLLEGGGELVMIDGGYGLYYEDVRGMLLKHSLDPGRIRRIFISHADADHAGMSGYFASEFGSRVHFHSASADIINHENRAYGSDSRISELNHAFTVLCNGFTRFHAPDQWIPFGENTGERFGSFPVIDSFSLAGQRYAVLESSGGHVPGQVFFVGEESGLLFTGDYLLSVDTLSSEDREILNIPKFMMTSTNVNSSLFRDEMIRLRDFAVTFDEKMSASGRGVMIIPGHGDYYPARVLM